MQRGTLLQLRNLINRRNITADIFGNFNEAIDFFELVVISHVSIHFRGMSDIMDSPTRNALLDISSAAQWPVLRHAIERIVDRYVMYGGIKEPSPLIEAQYNSHDKRIEAEHSYAASATQSALPQRRHRVLPQ